METKPADSARPLDEQRLAAYAGLIDQLLRCPSGEENTILNASLELLDEGFLAVLRSYAEALHQQGNPDAAAFLENLADKIAAFLQQGALRQDRSAMERQQAYGNLVQQLLACPAVEEQQILAANSELLGPEFVQFCLQAAQLLEEQNNPQAADWLRSFAAQLERTVPRASNSSGMEEQEAFLMRLLKTVVEANGDKAIVYTLLREHVHLLTAGLADLLEDWFTGTIQGKTSELQQGLAALMGNLGVLLQQFPLGDPRSNLQIAFQAYTNALRIYTKAETPQDWAGITINLACVYLDHASLSENPKEQIEKAIEIYINALQISTQDLQPKAWAHANNNLGNAYSRLAPFSESPNQQIENAIKAYSNALRCLTETELPQDYAMTNNNLGAAYTQLALISINPKQQLEKAIEAFSNSLRVCTEVKLPVDYAMANLNLGVTYSKLALVSEDPEQQIKKAISAYANALKVYTEAERPQAWADTINNLGTAYLDLAPFSENPKQQIEKAIDAYIRALRVCTEAERLHAWAGTNNNLGNAYSRLSPFSENPKQELEKAIEAYANALRVRTEEQLPQDWAMSNNNLGIAHYNLALAEENPRQSAERAIEAYTKALEVYTEAERPQNYANTQNNLGMAYCSLAPFSGNPKQQVEKAVEAYDSAFRVYTETEHPQDFARTSNNLGNAYYFLASFSENPKQQVEKAIEAFANALRVYTEAERPQDWATTNNNIANAYSDLAPYSENPKHQIEKAIEAYDNALRHLDPVTRSTDCLKTARNLGNLGFTNKLRTVAIDGYTRSITAVENMRAEALDPSRKAEILSQSIEVYANLVQVYVDAEQFDKALEVADRSKARNLVELLAAKDLVPKGDVPPEILRRLDGLRGSIARAERELNRSDSAASLSGGTAINPRGEVQSPSSSSAAQQAAWQRAQVARERLIQLKQELDQLIQTEIQNYDDSFSLSQKVQPLGFAELQASLPDAGTAILYWYAAGPQLLAFIVTADQPQPLCHRYPADTLEGLSALFNTHLHIYLTNKTEWQRALPAYLATLATALEIEVLLNTLQAASPQVDQLILTPHRFLHLLPLHALPLNAAGTCLLDRFTRGVRFAPSLQVLQLVQRRQAKSLESLFALANPGEDLAYAALEVASIQPLFGAHPTVLEGKAASRAQLERFAGPLAASHCLHFSCHGTFDFAEPLRSALLLADCEVRSLPADADPSRYMPTSDGGAIDLHQCLTLLDLFQLDLRQARLVALSACETGLSDIKSASDEFVGLSTGFLFAGCNSVIGTLWTVPDITTGLLMAHFYRLLKAPTLQGIGGVALALKEAQHWLRTLTLEQLPEHLDALRASLPPALSDNMAQNFAHDLQRLNRNHAFSDCPFSSPFYWAAFTAVGQ
jgi:CHAT domain-containing protein